MMKMSIGVMVLAAAMATLTGCRTVPITGRTQLMLSSEGEENALGATAFKDYKQQYKVSSNPTYTQALKRVGEAIKGVANQDSYQWEFVVLESSEANAFCLPGGKVAVYSGIFAFMSNDAELACVVAHEIAHALARHGGERMSWAKIQTLGLIGLMSGTQSDTVAALYGLTTDVAVMLPFSRSNETEADVMGLTLMARAGYNPQAAVTFWQKFGAGSTQSALAGWLSTHPGGEVRVRDLQEAMPNAMKEYQAARDKKNYGVLYTNASSR